MDRAATEGPRILSYLFEEQQAMVALLEEMTLAESPSSVPQSMRRVRAVVDSALQAQGFKTLPVRGRQSGDHLYARPARRVRHRAAQLLLGHYDTVWPMDTLRQMPFKVEGNIIKGPGVFDMKGGLMQMVFALKAIRELELDMPLTPVVFLNADEEIGSRESRPYIRALARRVNRAFVLEPAMGPTGRIKTARKGVGRFTIHVRGKAAHAGLDPEAGASAILELSYVIQQLFALNDLDQGITVNVGTIDGGLRPNVVAPESQAMVDVRVRTQEDAERLAQAIHNIEPTTPGITLFVEGGFGRPAMAPTPRNQALWKLARRLGTEIGLQLEHGHAGGGSDGNTTSQYTATLDGLGAVGDGAHARHEFLYLDKTIERTALLALLLLSPPPAP